MMVAPFIVIRTFRQGKLEGLKQSLPKFFEIIAAKEARLLAPTPTSTRPGLRSLHPHPPGRCFDGAP